MIVRPLVVAAPLSTNVTASRSASETLVIRSEILIL